MGYTRYKIPKSDGSYRIIEAPDKELKRQQKLILYKLSNAWTLPPHITCTSGRGVRDNAQIHMGAYQILKMDLKDFYHTVDLAHIRRGLTLLKQNITDNNLNSLDICHKIRNTCIITGYEEWPLAYLPMGAPTSPFLANIAGYTIDIAILDNLPDGMRYSRYIDDITVSSTEFEDMRPVIAQVTHAAEQAGFKINRKKTRVIYHDRDQVVTGVALNTGRGPSITRKDRRMLRAKLDHAAREGGALSQQTRGYLAWVKSVNEDLYHQMWEYYQKRKEKYGT